MSTIGSSGAAAQPRESQIHEGLVINGNVVGQGNLQLSGSVKGEIELEGGCLTITKSGYVEGEIRVDSARIAGELHGKVTATSNVIVADSGRIDGDVKTPRIAIHDGAKCRGNFEVGEAQ